KRFNITAHYAKLLALREQSSLAGNRASRALRVRVMDGYVWRPCATAAAPASPAPLNSQSARSRSRANARV
ncbi:MAG: hypothetical protein L6Q69_21965, partial [Zoogloea sp.]|nr:hypothetical protein [Zoogloea sp.]